jgi:hypothetical protein
MMSRGVPNIVNCVDESEGQMSFFMLLFIAAAHVPRPLLEMVLTCQNAKVSVGQTLKVELVITNRAKQAVTVDNGSLVSFTLVKDHAGAEIPQWPFMEIHFAPPGKDAFWTIKPGEVVKIPSEIRFARNTWSGFGIPGGSYQGAALEIGYESGKAIHTISSLPTTITLMHRWISDSHTVRDRAKKAGVRSAWSGALTSNQIKVELVEAD